MSCNGPDNGGADVGNLDAILAAIRGGRTRPFPIPAQLTPSPAEVQGLPVDRRRAIYQPRLELRKAINSAVGGYRVRKRIADLPWSAIAKQSEQLAKHKQALHDLFPESRTPSRRDRLTSDDTEGSALDWLVLRLAPVFEEILGEKPTTSWDDYQQRHYSPFIAFVLEVAKEAGIEIKSSTIHRALRPRKVSMNHKAKKKRSSGS
ncbi:hypothetical protein [Rhizobium mayense]|uniref:Uncharacterized protein n=1 Tax=Rhizobium mayense TaxID=1312184 RepID=A0ABT7JQ02_9HYPH|nr:hypothetical protein [Rhizobium mayense]MDL2398422.1 hypothetical protein [Rhizobium mayense]